MKVSVITVSFNAAKHIRRNIESVNFQTHSCIEHVFVDGGSLDGTRKIIEDHSKRANSLIFEEDSGIYDAMNKGMAAASGDIICFLNADDFYLHENVISDVVHIFDKTGCKLLTSNIRFINNNYNFTRNYKSVGFLPWMFKFGMMPAHPGTFLDAALARGMAPFSNRFIIAADFDFLLRAFRILNSEQIAELDRTTVIMQEGGVSTSGLKSNLIISKEIQLSLRLNKETHSLLLISSRFLIKSLPWPIGIKLLYFLNTIFAK